ncbi:hypothetical protein FACS189413_19610 [Bacteroidia bacterium]|nr:hypothetical protein FACS189413_19610 [Bacteroidia bacterium]
MFLFQSSNATTIISRSMMKTLDIIMEGVSMSKMEMNSLVGGDNTNDGTSCTCWGGWGTNNTNKGDFCKCVGITAQRLATVV